MNTRPGAASKAAAARTALAISLGALVSILTACGSTSSAPVRQRDLVVANPVSVSPGLATSTPARAQPDPEYPRRRPGAIVRAPRPGDDLGAPPNASASTPPPSTPQRATNNQIQSSIKVAAAEQPKASPPQPRPDPKPAVAPTPRPTPPPVAASGQWWTQTPASAPGRIRIVASGVGSNLREAREAAVESGLAKLRATLGADPEQVTYERTTVQPEGSGVLRGFVLVSCNDAP